MKSIRYGDTVTKAPSVIHQQIAEIQAAGGNQESVASVIQRAVSVLYAQEVTGELQKLADHWEKEYHALFEQLNARANEQ